MLLGVVGFWLVPVENEQVAETDISNGFGLLTERQLERSTPTPEPTPTVELVEPVGRKVLPIPDHYFQTFNNCGPATLAMTLSYFGVKRTQSELGNELRPYQNAAGDNDDKSVTLEELVNKAEELGFVGYHRPGGGIEMLQTLVANDLPVMVRTWTQMDEDIGHYRVVKGFDEERQVVIQDDSLQGKDVEIPYNDFLVMWEKFGYEYAVIGWPEEQEKIEAILGEDVDEMVAWRESVEEARVRVSENPGDIYGRFNLAVSLYEIGEYEESVEQFEQVESQLPFRTLWYQIEPLLAYQKLGRYEQLLPRIERILSGGNRAFSELYQMRGEIYLEQGRVEEARREFELALVYNRNYRPAQLSLSELN